MKLSELKSGMMFRSKTHSHADMVIHICDEECICWMCANAEAFEKYVSVKKGVKVFKNYWIMGKILFLIRTLENAI